MGFQRLEAPGWRGGPRHSEGRCQSWVSQPGPAVPDCSGRESSSASGATPGPQATSPYSRSIGTLVAARVQVPLFQLRPQVAKPSRPDFRDEGGHSQVGGPYQSTILGVFPPTTPHRRSCSGSDNKMAPPERKRHSIPPAPIFRPRLRNALIKLNSTGARPQPTRGVTAVRMRLGSSRREAGEK